jgi:hypothetical protein
LNKAAKDFLGKQKNELPIDITRMQEALNSINHDIVVEYCKQDALLAQELWDLVEDGLSQVGAEVDRPLSPAYIAGKFFLREHKRPSRHLNRLFRRSYRGGRIEMLRRGRHDAVFCYDIKSAYPSVAATLPDARDLTLVIDKEPHPDAVLGVYHVKVSTSPGEALGPVPIPGDVLTYPVGSFWTHVDLETLRMLLAFGWVEDIRESVEYHVAVHLSRPRLAFPQIPELYALRKNPELNAACKWLLNGQYGKFAQTNRKYVLVEDLLEADLIEYGCYLRMIESSGWHQDFSYAAAITGGARSKLFRAMVKKSQSVIQVMTDCVWSTEKLDLNEGKELGQWEREDYQSIIPVMTGVYSYKYENEWHSHFRGFETKHDLKGLLEKAKYGDSELSVDCKLPIGILWSLQNGYTPNTIDTWQRKLDLNADIKRVWNNKATANTLLTEQEHSYPHILRKG